MHQTGRLKRLCIACSAFYLLYACLLAGLSHAGFSSTLGSHNLWPWLGDKPIGEDGFYMLTVADRLSTTHHLTYNFGSSATGIQPLSTLLYAGVAVLLRPLTHSPDSFHFALLRVVLLLGAALSIAFAWMLADLSQRLPGHDHRPLVFTFAYLITLFDFTSFRLFTYGLETGVYLCALAYCLRRWLKVVAHRSNDRRQWSNILLLGISGGLAGLVRIDFGLIFAVLLLWLLLRRLASPLQTFVAGVVALGLVSPWFLFVHHATGGWMPTSGLVEGRRDWQMYAHSWPWACALLAHLVPWSYAGAGNQISVAFGCASLFLLVGLLWVQRKTIRWIAIAPLVDTLLPWAIAVIGLTTVYAGLFVSTFFYTRYFAPMMIITIPLIALLFAATPVFERRPLLLVLPLVAIFGAFEVVTLQLGRPGNPHFPAVAYVRSVMPEVRIGAFQSGVLGYFNPNVENLDGKLNQAAWIAARNGHLDTFLDGEQINVLLDWPSYLQRTLPTQYLSEYWQRCPIPPPNAQDICLVRKSYLAAHPNFR